MTTALTHDPVGDATCLKTHAGFWGDHLDQEAPAVPWLWEGYAAGRMVTLLTSQSGKTTLLSILLSRFKEGGTLADLPVAKTRPIVVSEEPAALWRPRHQQLDLRHVYFLCRPFSGKPTLEQWLGLLDHIAGLRREHGFGFVAFDTLSTLLPAGSENNADCAMQALLPLQKLADDGMGIWLQHHPRKGACLPGQAARGTGAFGGLPDFVLEMHRCPRAQEDDRRRRLVAFSRSDRTPRQLVLELNADATDYRSLGDFTEDEFAANWERLRLVLEDADDKLTRRDILAQWPADFAKPADTTLWHWLCRAARLGLVNHQGTGRKNDPFRYWLPAKQTEWNNDPLHLLREQTQMAQADVRKMWAEWHRAKRQVSEARETGGLSE